MKVCPNCQNKYPDDANFCPREACATGEGPSRLVPAVEEVPQRFAPTARLGGSLSGEVWQARDNQTGEIVAYKLVATQSLPSPVAVDRAQRELKQLLRSQSPRIAKVIDYGKAADGRLYIATELCSGEPLDRIVEKAGPLPLERAKKILAQIGEALLEGQKVGVVHHDLAPKNVLVDGDDQVKVINFAIPRSSGDKIFGVPEFLSPEQAEGKLSDQRSNTYSVGAIATFLLTGAPPFSGATTQAVLEQVIHGELTPPSQRRAELTPEIDRVILKAMDKSSSRRPLTMRQFLGDLAAMHLGGASAVATRPVAGAGFAKTMMYAGGAPEVRRLVAEATAARAEANGSGPAVAYSPVPAGSGAPAPAARVSEPAPAPTAAPIAKAPALDPASQPTPPPAAAQRAHGAAVAATMVAMPAAQPAVLGGPVTPARVAATSPLGADPHPQSTPPPVTPPPVTGDDDPQGRKATAGQGANFRETLWFKKGDVEQMVADAKAKTAAAAAPKGRPPSLTPGEMPVEDGKPLEDRYVDDGSVTVEDRHKFSLGSGGTAASMPAARAETPGDRMSESEMLNEIGGRKRITIIAFAAVAVAVVVLVLAVTLKGKGGAKAPAPPPSAAAVAKPPEEPAVPVAPKPTPATEGAAPGDNGEPARAKEAGSTKEPAAPTKARSAKKKAAKRAAAKKKR
jgi:hypothetical protein